MRHFGHLAPEVREHLFHRQPRQFTDDAPAPFLAMALGATLYSPATRPTLAEDIVKQADRGVISMVLCLEDSIGDSDVATAEENLIQQLTRLLTSHGPQAARVAATQAQAQARDGVGGGADGDAVADGFGERPGAATRATMGAGVIPETGTGVAAAPDTGAASLPEAAGEYGAGAGADGHGVGDGGGEDGHGAGVDGLRGPGASEAREQGQGGGLPLLFIRVRAPEQIPDLVRRLGPAVRLLSGFVLPKFTEERGVPFLEALTTAENASGRRLFAMPVLESPELLHLETRTETLAGIARTVDKYRDRVLALRLGVTDFCSAYGLRRAPDMTAYDVHIVAAVIADVVNVLGRADGTGFTVTGPVWEYFRMQERIFKPQLRQSPFHGRAEGLRNSLIEHDLDGLLREIELDRANGLFGKTCIHPSHVLPVHALSVVSHEEFSDAQDILQPDRDGGGVLRSTYTNKMNEVKPHRAWAERILHRAEVFGVARENVGFVELLAAGIAG